MSNNNTQINYSNHTLDKFNRLNNKYVNSYTNSSEGDNSAETRRPLSQVHINVEAFRITVSTTHKVHEPAV